MQKGRPQAIELKGGWWWALKDLNLRPTDYESAALTAELRALTFKFNNLLRFMLSAGFPVGIFVRTLEVPAASASLSASTSATFAALSLSIRWKARSMPSGVGCTYRCDTVTLLCLAMRMMVKACAPASPRLVSIVCLSEWITSHRIVSVYRGLGCAGDPERVEIQTVVSGLDRTVPLVV